MGRGAVPGSGGGGGGGSQYGPPSGPPANGGNGVSSLCNIFERRLIISGAAPDR